MRFPVLREWVRVEGREGAFLVIGINRSRGSAGVIAASGKGGVVIVPLTAVLPLGTKAECYSPFRE